MSITSLGQTSLHHEQYTQESSKIITFPVISGTLISSFNIQVEQTCLIAFSGQTLLQIPQNTHLDKSTSMLLFSLSTVDVGMFLTVIASTGHNSAQKPQ